MNKILHSLSSPWRHGGVIAGVLDMLLRMSALIIWCAVAWLALLFIKDAIFVEIIWVQKMWWLGYSALILTTVSMLAYTAIWDRK
ncbi:MAG: hypothetical protein LBG16_01145 [Elusimicrobiota bacterium]|jgi:hypothetical protein|nr:hypothetical protein [Elusimicrobiota bacterium]